MSSSMAKTDIGLFEAFGIEIELMLVDRDTLDVKPCADSLLTAAAGALTSDFEDGPVTWSNELVSHVIEFKTTAPAKTLEDLEEKFARSQEHAQRLLAQMNARLMPTGMHPWMNPSRETKLWAHDNNEIYSLYNEIFDCRGHGWSNLQSVHINLPFKNETEFKKLHSAVRIVLPLLPALAASSPFADGATSGEHDTRLAYYETNQKRLPVIAGDIIPVSVTGIADYRHRISDPIQTAIAPFDKAGILKGDWLNSRGAIARFDRGTIEIRLLDTQECPHADLTIVQFVVNLVRSLVTNESLLAKADTIPTTELREIYRSVVRDAESAPITNSSFLSLFDLVNSGDATASRVLKSIFENHFLNKPSFVNQNAAFQSLLERPSLATRLLEAAGPKPNRERLKLIYENLCHCLDENKIFEPSELQDGAALKKQCSSNSRPEQRAEIR